MRGLTTIFVLLGTAAVGTGVAQWHFARQEVDRQVVLTREAVDRVRQELMVRSATRKAELSVRGFPNTIDPAWFVDSDPVNMLLSDRHPWVEIAGPHEADLDHPATRLAIEETDAGLWYNPYRGVVRARVPVTVSDSEALSLYNRINGTALPDLFWTEPPQRLSTIADKSNANDAVDQQATAAADTASSQPTIKNKAPLRRNGRKQAIVVVHRRSTEVRTPETQTTDASPSAEP